MPCSQLRVNLHFGVTCRLRLQYRKNKSSKESANQDWSIAWLILRTWVAKSSFQSSVDFQRTTWRYIPEGRTLHSKNRLLCSFAGLNTIFTAFLLKLIADNVKGSQCCHIFNYYIRNMDCLCGLVVRAPDYRPRGPGSLPDFLRRNGSGTGIHSASWVQLRSYLEEKVAAPV
jgi:hypothetical protein